MPDSVTTIALLGLAFLGAAVSGCTFADAAPPAPSPERAAEFASSRGARLAIARGPEAPRLTCFATGLSREQIAELQQIAPRVHIENDLPPDEALRRAAEAHAIDAGYATPEFLRAAENLVWVQSRSAGVDRVLRTPELTASERIVLTNMRAVHGPAIADHAFAMLLTLTRDLPIHLAGRATGQWNEDGSGTLRPIALADRTLLVVGLGGIGTEIARRGHGFGMRVIATRRSSTEAPPFVDRVERPTELRAMLGEADVVAVAVPLTDETEGLFDDAAFAAMKPGSYLVNISRGRVVRTDALLHALQSGHLAGACLDVTEPEPLPASHPLWSLPNVVITPHCAGVAELTEQRAWSVYRENMRRFDAGEPLLNVVDKSAGY